MKIIFLMLLLSFVGLKVTASIKTNVYFIHGHGSDHRIFDKIILDSSFNRINVQMPNPEKKETIKSYAIRLVPQIDTTKKFILIGVSFGGMVCTELTDLLKPEKTIIISSAKCRKELPGLYRFQKFVPFNKIVPKGLVKLGAKLLQPIVEPDRRRNKDIFKAMLRDKSPVFFKRVSNLLVNWERKEYNPDIIHIHGSKDHTLPVRNINADYIIKGGSHMMTLTKGEEMNTLILSLLK